MSVSLWVYFINRHNGKIPHCSFLMIDAGVLAEIDPKETVQRARILSVFNYSSLLPFLWIIGDGFLESKESIIVSIDRWW